ncbi:MAG: DUF3465 domain-containing protein, partial [Desulfocapsaceae bacterium]
KASRKKYWPTRQTIIVVLLLVLTLVAFYDRGHWPFSGDPGEKNAGTSEELAQAFENRLSNIPVQGAGAVAALLKDDTSGSRHQRFILRLDNGQTVLIAHNIDIAPRIEALKIGDRVTFAGEYEWNEKGGVVHWTHHDPRKKHADGWLRHNNRLYQ